MDTIKQLIKQYMPVITVALLVLLVLAIGLLINGHIQNKREQPVILKQETAKNPKQLGNALHVTETEAQEVISKKERTQPIATYYTQAPTVEVAAEQVKKDIAYSNPNVPKAVTEKSDRTAVVANTDEQKVDVYKINLNKGHKIKAGVTLIDKRAFETIGYQAGKFEVLTHFNGQHLEGGSVLYTVKEW